MLLMKCILENEDLVRLQMTSARRETVLNVTKCLGVRKSDSQYQEI